MSTRKQDNIEIPPESKSAMEILQGFLDDVHKIDGMDPAVASIIKKLWDESRLGSDELLAALKEERARGNNDAKEED